jgi:hypothetical protein
VKSGEKVDDVYARYLSAHNGPTWLPELVYEYTGYGKTKPKYNNVMA